MQGVLLGLAGVNDSSTSFGVTANGHLKCSYHTTCPLAGWSSYYRYMADLLCLDAARPAHNHQYQTLSVISTPLCLQEWERSLANHPDTAFASYICTGLREGFRIGFRHGSPLKSADRNMESATHHPTVVREYLQNECTRGRMLGPFSDPTKLPPLHISRLGLSLKGTTRASFS